MYKHRQLSNWIRELSNSIKELSNSTGELSYWIGELSNSIIFPYRRRVGRIRELFNWIKELIQLQSAAKEYVRSLIVHI